MGRLLFFLILVAIAASGLAWLADRPGDITVVWLGWHVETSVFHAAIMLLALVVAVPLVWSLGVQLWRSPAIVGRVLSRRRQQRGLDALSSGMIAVGAGDPSMATRYAVQARRSLPNEPLTHLLRAQAAQMSGDRTTARRIFEAMLATPDTEQLGLRGLFLEAQREGEHEAAEQFAERAVRLNPRLAWPVEALFDLQCRRADWSGALDTLATARRFNHVSKVQGDRRRAVLLTARAQDLEDGEPERALTLALEAHGLAPSLVPPAAIAARLLAARGNTPRATRTIERTWAITPHPDLATAYAFARIGDSPLDRLERVRRLAKLAPGSAEGVVAKAAAAIEARAFEEARATLEPLLTSGMTQRVCLLMARIESGENADAGRAREWLARAVSAARDPAWTADGMASGRWLPVSPVTGRLDAFTWRVPSDETTTEGTRLARQLEALAGCDVSDPALMSGGGKQAGEQPRESATAAAGQQTRVPVEATAGRIAADSPRPVTSWEAEKQPVGRPPAAGRDGRAVSPRPARTGARETIALPPRAPDDPGPDSDGDEAGLPLRPAAAT